MNVGLLDGKVKALGVGHVIQIWGVTSTAYLHSHLPINGPCFSYLINNVGRQLIANVH